MNFAYICVTHEYEECAYSYGMCVVLLGQGSHKSTCFNSFFQQAFQQVLAIAVKLKPHMVLENFPMFSAERKQFLFA